MPAIQTDYSRNMKAGYPGLVRNMETANTISRTIEQVGGLGFGLPSVQGVNGVIGAGSSTFATTAAAAAGNTGNGVMTSAPTAGGGIEEGRYSFLAVSPTRFVLEDPDGREYGVATVGQAVTGPLNFTISAGSTPFAAGDRFTADVDATAGGVFRGLTIRDRTLVVMPTLGQMVDVYQQGDTAGLLTAGVMFVTAGGVVKIGDPVFFDTVAQQFNNVRGGFAIPNAFFDAPASIAGDLTLVRLSAY